MLDNVLAAIPFGILLAFTIGPVFFVLLETSATKGFTSAIIFDLGVILADVVFIALALFSTSGLVDKLKDDPNVLVLGGVILSVYGLMSYIKTSRSYRSIVKEYHRVEFQKNYHRLFFKGFLLNFINIGVLIGWLALILVANSVTESSEGVYTFLATILIVYLLVDIVKISVAKKIKHLLTPRIIYKTKKIVSLLILGFGVLLLVQGFFPKEKEMIQNRFEEITH